MTPLPSLPTLAATTLVAAAAALGFGGHVAHANHDPFGGRLTGVHAQPLYREPPRLVHAKLRSVHCVGHSRGALCYESGGGAR
jgi:hypothetical protein